MKQKKEQPFNVLKRLKSFKYAFNGIRVLYMYEHNFRIHTIAALLVVSLGYYLEITRIDWALLVFAIAFVFVTEALNTAIESTCDAVTLEFRPSLKIAKDVAAGAVLFASITAVIIAALVLKPYLL